MKIVKQKNKTYLYIYTHVHMSANIGIVSEHLNKYQSKTDTIYHFLPQTFVEIKLKVYIIIKHISSMTVIL